MASNEKLNEDDESDDDSDEWGMEELDMTPLTLNTESKTKEPEVATAGGGIDDEKYWSAASATATSTAAKQNKPKVPITKKKESAGNPIIIVDMTQMSDSKIHSKFDPNSVNDFEAASELRKKIESKYGEYSKDVSLLADRTVIPCSSNVYRDALVRLRGERPGHYFCPVFPPKK